MKASRKIGFVLTLTVSALSLPTQARVPKKSVAAKSVAPDSKPPTAPTPDSVPAVKMSYSQASPLTQKPFWKSKPELMKKMVENREIIVSVHRDDAKTGMSSFSMAGAGVVARDKDAAFAVGKQFEKLKDVSDHFQTVTYDPKDGKLFVVVQALGYQARMLMRLATVSEDWRSEIQWEVIWGSFTGMKGVIGFERLGPRSTEVSFTGNFQAKELPLPKVLMSFALEVVTQKVAESMRHAIESQTL